MLNRFNSKDDIVTGTELEKLSKLMEEKLKIEQKRVEAVRADDSNYEN